MTQATLPQAQNTTGVVQPQPEDRVVVTKHSVVIDDVTIPYSVMTGTLVLREEVEVKEGSGEEARPKASIFFVAYTRDEPEDLASRPLTFAFNGGPGSSSVWLHLGLLGPRRVWMDEEGNAPPPPYRLVDNEYSVLDVTDLVFIDPVSTGYSRAVPGEEPRQFHGFKKDIESVGEFIRLYTTRQGRWSSPKYLIGESYGTTRAAGLSSYLQERHGYYLNGILLVSTILNFQTAYFNPGNDLPYPLFLPTYAATAWYHGRVSAADQADLSAFLAEAEAFAAGEFTLALQQGSSLPADRRAAVIEQLARFTGLSADYIDRADLRINIHKFVKELLRDQRRTVGRLDSRFKGIDRDAVGEVMEFDPSYTNIQGPYTATLNDYVRRELGFENDLPYEILTERVHPWEFDHSNRYVDVSESLRKAMSINPHLRVFVANGFYDLATPYFATRYTFNHLALDPSLHANISMFYYQAGHMMYIHQPSMQKLRSDLVEFLNFEA
jgi:carboxypeptidase C (cathepsin A)